MGEKNKTSEQSAATRESQEKKIQLRDQQGAQGNKQFNYET